MTKTSALSSLLTAAAKGATTIGSAFDTVNNGISMADRFVTKASDEQRKRYLKEGKLFDQNLAHELARETSELKRAADEYVTQHGDLQEVYESTYNEFLAELQPS